MWSALVDRKMTPEIMDDPGIDPGAHHAALEGLRKINLVSKTASKILAPIAAFARGHQLSRLTMLDVACGGGDVPIAIAVLARRIGIDLDLTLMDRSAMALKHASQAARCHCIEADATDWPALGQFDVVTCSLFLHHVQSRDSVVKLLENMRQSTGRMMVVSDLRRCMPGYIAAWMGCRILSRSAIVHHDGPVSVEAAWTMDELSEMANAAKMSGAVVSKSSPWRMLLKWERA